jgi:hypothetical protein
MLRLVPSELAKDHAMIYKPVLLWLVRRLYPNLNATADGDLVRDAVEHVEHLMNHPLL